MPIDEVLRIARQLLSALARAHDKGLVHRDLKPENVMLDVDGNVKVLDFGLAKVRAGIVPRAAPSTPSVAETALSPTEEGRVIGTPGYMAPEQTRSPDVDARADLFSFGVILYEMLTGVRPFTGATTFDVMVAIARDEPVPIATLRPEVPMEVRSVIEGCLRKRAETRFGGATDVLAALDHERRVGGAPSSANSRYRVQLATMICVIAIALCGLMMSVFRPMPSVARTAASTAPQDASSTVAILQSTGFRYLDVPPSPTTSDAAVAAYSNGMRAMRDGDGASAVASFEEALVADPSFASAHFQRCFVYFLLEGALEADMKAQCFEALGRKVQLSARDDQLLEAITPTFGDPPTYDEALRRLQLFASRWPSDAQGWDAIGTMETKLSRPRDAVAAFDNEVRADPDAAVIVREQLLAHLGETELAMKHLQACVTRKPLDIACHDQLASFYRTHGDCTEMDRVGRDITAIAPDQFGGYYVRAGAAAGLSASREVIDELKAMAAARIRSPWRASALLDITIQSAIATGDLGTALRDLTAIKRDHGASADTLEGDVIMRIRLLLETGETAAAGAVANAFLGRLRALPVFDRPAGETTGDRTGELLGYALLAKLISPEEQQRRFEDWVESWRVRFGSDGFADARPFLLIQSRPIDLLSRGEAERSVATIGDFAKPANLYFGVLDGRYGELLRRAGHIDEAIVRLEAATHVCSDSRWPPDFFHLGQAYETNGDTPSACRAYSAVLRFWGHAKPRSLTADAARARFTKLACPAP